MNEYLIAALVGAMVMPALAGVVSFLMWQNAFKDLGWKFIARLSVVMAVAAPLIMAHPGGAS
ncbi:hypothetical protein [Erwinia aphidicola]|uniref:hypothetical protein n=1 Tax=Erwinia aphidicola TaxID=68334 RepID=UPI00301B0335